MLVKRALEEPLRQIAHNAGAEGSVVVDVVKKRGQRPRLQRPRQYVRGHVQGRHRGSREGDTVGLGKRGLDSSHAADNRDPDNRPDAASPAMAMPHGEMGGF
jgi:chaperonin GroEL (HSP60 family)